ncbi:hypothetical protein KSS87_007411 [Heliosperma pusillum]|nr:hypothetical protein KSS87_007411 [Heliosperma pusillum]
MTHSPSPLPPLILAQPCHDHRHSPTTTIDPTIRRRHSINQHQLLDYGRRALD